MKKPPSYRKKSIRSKSGFIDYAFVRLDGKDVLLGKWNSKESKTKYKSVISQWLSPVLNDSQTPSELTVSEICVDYANDAKQRYRKLNGKCSNEWNMVQRILKDVRRLYGKSPASEFKSLRFKAMRDEFVKQGLSRYTVNKYSRHIIRAFQLAAENEKLSPENYQSMQAVKPLQKGKTKAPEADRIQPIDESTVETTLQHLHGIAVDMVRIQLLTGMRPGEVCQLKPNCIDSSGEIWLFKPEHHKNEHRDQSRVICIGKQAQDILRPYLLRDKDSFCFEPSEAVEQVRRRRNLERNTPEGQGNVRGSSLKHGKRKRTAGNQYSTSAYRRAIHRACDAAGIPRWSPNRLRKTAGTKIRRETGSLEVAQAVLGHKSRSTTERFYAEIDVTLAADIMKKIG